MNIPSATILEQRNNRHLNEAAASRKAAKAEAKERKIENTLKSENKGCNLKEINQKEILSFDCSFQLPLSLYGI